MQPDFATASRVRHPEPMYTKSNFLWARDNIIVRSDLGLFGFCVSWSAGWELFAILSGTSLCAVTFLASESGVEHRLYSIL